MDFSNINKFEKVMIANKKKLYLTMSSEEARGMGWGVSGMVKAVEVILDVDDGDEITGGVINFGEEGDYSVYGSDFLEQDDAVEVYQFIESGEMSE